jgi:serine/threonine protein kinase
MTVLYNIYHAKEPPKIPSNLSAQLKDFISCCLKIEPGERWNVYKLLRHHFITGDHFSFLPYANSHHQDSQRLEQSEQNIEFENKFYSEEKNTR